MLGQAAVELSAVWIRLVVPDVAPAVSVLMTVRACELLHSAVIVKGYLPAIIIPECFIRGGLMPSRAGMVFMF